MCNELVLDVMHDAHLEAEEKLSSTLFIQAE